MEFDAEAECPGAFRAYWATLEGVHPDAVKQHDARCSALFYRLADRTREKLVALGSPACRAYDLARMQAQRGGAEDRGRGVAVVNGTAYPCAANTALFTRKYR